MRRTSAGGPLSIDDLGRERFASDPWSVVDRRRFDVRVSTRTEPEGILRACLRFVIPHKHRTVHIATDSASAAALAEGHSLSYWMNDVARRLQESFPGARFTLAHTPGDTNPADAISRGAMCPTAAEWDFTRGCARSAHIRPHASIRSVRHRRSPAGCPHSCPRT